MLLKAPDTRVHEQVPELAYLGPCVWTVPSDRSSIRGLGFLGGVAYWSVSPERRSILPGDALTARAVGTLAMLGETDFGITRKLWDRAVVPAGNIHEVVPAYLSALEKRFGANRGTWLQHFVDAREMGVVQAADLERYWSNYQLVAAKEVATTTDELSAKQGNSSLPLRRALATLPGAWQSATLLGTAYALRECTAPSVNIGVHELSKEEMAAGRAAFEATLAATLARSA